MYYIDYDIKSEISIVFHQFLCHNFNIICCKSCHNYNVGDDDVLISLSLCDYVIYFVVPCCSIISLH